MGVRVRDIYVDLVNSMGEKASEYSKDESRSKGTQTLEQYSRDLTAMATEGRSGDRKGRRDSACHSGIKPPD